MIKYLLILAALMVGQGARAGVQVEWPVVPSMKITGCWENWTDMDPCKHMQTIEVGGVVIEKFETNVPVPNGYTSGIMLARVACYEGGEGRPFAVCKITGDHNWTTTGPRLPLYCTLKDTQQWVTRNCDRLTSHITQIYGINSEMVVGSYCLFATLRSPSVTNEWAAWTPWGELSADEIANGAHGICPAYEVPPQTCNIDLPGEIVHGMMPLDGVDTRSIHGGVRCSGKWAIRVLGGGRLVLGPGVYADLTVGIDSSRGVVATSVMHTSSSASPGAYIGTAVVEVAPE